MSPEREKEREREREREIDRENERKKGGRSFIFLVIFEWLK